METRCRVAHPKELERRRLQTVKTAERYGNGTSVTRVEDKAVKMPSPSPAEQGTKS